MHLILEHEQDIAHLTLEKEDLQERLRILEALAAVKKLVALNETKAKDLTRQFLLFEPDVVKEMSASPDFMELNLDGFSLFSFREKALGYGLDYSYCEPCDNSQFEGTSYFDDDCDTGGSSLNFQTDEAKSGSELEREDFAVVLEKFDICHDFVRYQQRPDSPLILEQTPQERNSAGMDLVMRTDLIAFAHNEVWLALDTERKNRGLFHKEA
jgi:hypothetical protein